MKQPTTKAPHSQEQDGHLNPIELEDFYGAEHPKHKRREWQENVAAGLCSDGYWDWTYNQIHDEMASAPAASYNHLYTLSFSVPSDENDPSAVTEDALVDSLRKRIAEVMRDGGLAQAVEHYDTVEFGMEDDLDDEPDDCDPSPAR